MFRGGGGTFLPFSKYYLDDVDSDGDSPLLGAALPALLSNGGPHLPFSVDFVGTGGILMQATLSFPSNEVIVV